MIQLRQHSTLHVVAPMNDRATYGRMSCIRCGTVRNARKDRIEEVYICNDCRLGDPEYVTMVTTEERNHL